MMVAKLERESEYIRSPHADLELKGEKDLERGSTWLLFHESGFEKKPVQNYCHRTSRLEDWR